MANKTQVARRSVMLFFITVLGVYEAVAVAANPRNGEQLYDRHCAGCHGPTGQGMMPGMPNFARGEGLFQPDANIVRMLEEGRGAMPAYRGILTTNDMLDVTTYLRTLQ